MFEGGVQRHRERRAYSAISVQARGGAEYISDRLAQNIFVPLQFNACKTPKTLTREEFSQLVGEKTIEAFDEHLPRSFWGTMRYEHEASLDLTLARAAVWGASPADNVHVCFSNIVLEAARITKRAA
jgi:hypothetical protein